MTEGGKNPKVDGYLRKVKKWREELTELRRIILETEVQTGREGAKAGLDSGSEGHLTEEVKWMHPCYTVRGKNIVLINEFKEFCAMLFVKGALLKDPKKILDRVGEHTQAGRWIKFTSVEQIREMEPVLKAYIREAVAAEKAGLKVKKKETADYEVAEEFQAKLDEKPALKAAFEALTPGRQRGYLLYFSGAKQSKTRAARVEKCTPRILKGKGLED